MALNEKERLLELLDKLREKEIGTIRKIAEKMAEKNLEKRELEEFLKLSESSFSDWDNEEDDVYNDL